jgi:1-acyl-sn-glycerol-3-phosphate acyltransferase
VSNHLSWADTALISHLPWEMKWLSKSSIFLFPFVGWSMYLAGDISLHRGEKTSAKDAMVACKQWLEKGANIMIFPEVCFNWGTCVVELFHKGNKK